MAKKQSGTPTLAWILVPLIALAFLGFLFYLATVPAGSSYKPNEKPAPSVKEPAKPAKPAQASKPESNNYDFYKLLENQKVEVPKVEAYKSTPKDAEVSYQYQLQVASFRSQADADALRASLLLEGLTAYTKASAINGNQWYRVYVGPFDNRSKMNQAHDKLAARGLRPLELKEAKAK